MHGSSQSPGDTGDGIAEDERIPTKVYEEAGVYKASP